MYTQSYVLSPNAHTHPKKNQKIFKNTYKNTYIHTHEYTHIDQNIHIDRHRNTYIHIDTNTSTKVIIVSVKFS